MANSKGAAASERRGDLMHEWSRLFQKWEALGWGELTKDEKARVTFMMGAIETFEEGIEKDGFVIIDHDLVAYQKGTRQ